MQIKNQQLEPNLKQHTDSKLGKECIKAVYCYPVYLTSIQSASCEMLSWMKHKLDSRFPEEISIIISPLIAFFKNINKFLYLLIFLLKYKKMEMVTNLFSWAPKSLWKVTAAMKLKTLAPWKKSYERPRHHIKKQRHYFADKVRIVKPMVFSVVMYGCERWTTEKAEHRRIDGFAL